MGYTQAVLICLDRFEQLHVNGLTGDKSDHKISLEDLKNLKSDLVFRSNQSIRREDKYAYLNILNLNVDLHALAS